MKRSTKVISVIILFFMIIAGVVVARTMIGNHFKKKFGKRPPPGIIVKTVEERKFQNKIETFGTAVPIRVQSYNIEKYEILEPIKFNKKVKSGEIIVKLKNRNIIAPFDGVIGKRNFQNKIETFGTAVPIRVQSYNIEKYEILEPIKFNKKVNAGDVIVKLKNRNIIAPFDGVIG